MMQGKCDSDERIQYVTLGDIESTTKIMIVCGTHARELITSDTCMNIINHIVNNKDQYEDIYAVIIPVLNTNR